MDWRRTCIFKTWRRCSRRSGRRRGPLRRNGSPPGDETRNGRKPYVLMMTERRPAHPDGGPGKDEAKLISKAKYDRAAFGELYERYLQKIYTYLYYRTGNHADAEDLTSKVFHKAYVHLPGYESLGLPFSAWLYRIAHNILANWYRDQGRRRGVRIEEVVRHSTEENPGHSEEKSG